MKTLGILELFLGVPIAQSLKGLILFQQDLIYWYNTFYIQNVRCTFSVYANGLATIFKIHGWISKIWWKLSTSYWVPTIPCNLHKTGLNCISLCSSSVYQLSYNCSLGISYNKTSVNKDITAYADSSWASDIDTRRSHTGYFFKVANHLISWQSKRTFN